MRPMMRLGSRRFAPSTLVVPPRRNIHATASHQASDLTADFGKKHVARGLNRAMDAVIKSGSGSYLEMEDGRKMLDFTCGIAVTNLGESVSIKESSDHLSDLLFPGHCHPKVSQAAAKQAMTLVHGQVPTTPAAAISSTLLKRIFLSP